MTYDDISLNPQYSDVEEEITPQPPKTPSQIKKPIILVLVIIGILLSVSSVFGFFLFKKQSPKIESKLAQTRTTLPEPTTTPLPSLIPSPSPSLEPTTKPTPRATIKPTPKPSPTPLNYDQLIVLEKNSIELETQFGETRETGIKIVNNSDKKIYWTVVKKICETNGAGCPIGIKSSPQNIYTELEAKQTGAIVFEGWPFTPNPRLEVVFDIAFYDMSTADNKLTTKTVKALLISPVHENVLVESNYDDRTTGNSNVTLNFKPRYLTPIIIKNRHNFGVRWSCQYQDSSMMSAVKYECGSSSGGWLPAGDGWHTDMQFHDEYTGPTTFDIRYEFSDSQGKVVDTKILTVQVNK